MSIVNLCNQDKRTVEEVSISISRSLVPLFHRIQKLPDKLLLVRATFDAVNTCEIMKSLYGF